MASHAPKQAPHTHDIRLVRTGSGRGRRGSSLVSRNSGSSRRCCVVNSGFNDAQQALSPKEATCAAVTRRIWTARRCASVGSVWRWMFLVVVLLLSRSSLYTCTAAAAAASKTYYSVLGVEPNVSQDGLKRAYRRAAVKWHPDKNTGNTKQAEKKFKEIQQAYDVLRDPRSRGDYDDDLRNRGRSNQGFSPNSRSSPRRNDPGEFFSADFFTRMREQA
ncbi:unnamed protein product, partial [Laminaria digitata]